MAPPVSVQGGYLNPKDWLWIKAILWQISKTVRIIILMQFSSNARTDSYPEGNTDFINNTTTHRPGMGKKSGNDPELVVSFYKYKCLTAELYRKSGRDSPRSTTYYSVALRTGSGGLDDYRRTVGEKSKQSWQKMEEI